MSNRAIKLTFSTPAVVKFKGRDTFRVQVVASDGVDIPDEIFGHQRTLVDPYTLTYQDEFCFVCSALDLSTYPANEPNSEQSPPFFRKAVADFLTPGVATAQEAIAEIRKEVECLISSLNQLDELEPGSEEWVGPEPVDDSSESSIA